MKHALKKTVLSIWVFVCLNCVHTECIIIKNYLALLIATYVFFLKLLKFSLLTSTEMPSFPLFPFLSLKVKQSQKSKYYSSS